MDKLVQLHNVLYDYIEKNWHKSFNEPVGTLKHVFLDPAANYRFQLWDWDSYFCGLALIDVYEDTAEYIKGCVLNFTDNAADDGSIPYMINAGEKGELSYAEPQYNKIGRTEESEVNSIKPLLAQMTLLAASRLKDNTWVEEIYGILAKHIMHWEKTQMCAAGLFVWRSYRGSGTDNHPALYGRPLNSSAGVELNCFMYKEYKAMAEISKMCDKPGAAEEYEQKAIALADNINAHMWDEIDGLYYNLDVLSKKPRLAIQDITWDVPLKFKTWTCFTPMWAGIAPKEYADRMVREHLLNPLEFWSDYGIRTLAKNEKMYTVAETSNPSNWQGPIWIVSTYLVFKGLINYGYNDNAKNIAQNLISNMVRDINENGFLHEYYNPETGLSSIAPGFMNWNALAGLMVPELSANQSKLKERDVFND